MNTQKDKERVTAMSKLFRKKKTVKNKEEKPHIARSLIPAVAFAAVPESPPPSTDRDTARLSRHASAPVISVGTQVDSPPDPQRGGNQLDSDGDSVASEPGYSTVRNTGAVARGVRIDRSSQRDKGTSGSSAAATPLQNRPLPCVPQLSLDKLDHPLESPLLDQVISTSSLPSVTSGISIHSDSEEEEFPRPSSARAGQLTSPSPVSLPLEGNPVYSTVDKGKKNLKKHQQHRDGREGDSMDQHSASRLPAHAGRAVKLESVDHPLSDDSLELEGDGGEDAPYFSPTSFSPHRPPPSPHKQDHQHRPSSHRHHSHSFTEGATPSSPSVMAELPVYTLHEGTQLPTGEIGYLFSRTSPRGSQQQFVATPVHISPVPSQGMATPRSHSTPVHGAAPSHTPPATTTGRGRAVSVSPTQSHSPHAPSSYAQATAEILQKLAAGSLPRAASHVSEEGSPIHPSTVGVPLGSGMSGERNAPTQITAEILQQLAAGAGSLPGAHSHHSSGGGTSFHSPQYKSSPLPTRTQQAGETTAPTQATAEILQQLAEGSLLGEGAQFHASGGSSRRENRRVAATSPAPTQAAAEILQQLASNSLSGAASHLDTSGLPHSPRSRASSSPLPSNGASLLTAELETLRSKNSSLVAENTSLREQCSNLQKESKTMERELHRETTSLQDSMALKEKIRAEQQKTHQLKRKALESELAHVTEEKNQAQRQLQVQIKNSASARREERAKVDQLKTNLLQQRAERDQLKYELAAIKSSHAQLQGRVTALAESSNPPRRHVSLQHHRETLNNFESLMQSLLTRAKNDNTRKDAELEDLKQQNRLLKEQISRMKVTIGALEDQNCSLQAQNRSCEERASLLEDEMETAHQRQLRTVEQLSEVVVKAEKAASERDAYARIVDMQSKAKDRSLLESARRELTVQKFHRKMEAYGQQVSSYRDKTEQMLKCQQKRQKTKEKSYQEKLRYLQSQLHRRDEQLQALEKSKMRAEEQLNLLWSATSPSRHPA